MMNGNQHSAPLGGILLRLGVLMSVVVAIGVGGYVWIEGYSPLEALYMTIITISTVGFGEVRPLSDAGRLFTIFLIISSVGIVTYSVSSLSLLLLDGSLQHYLRQWRMRKAIQRLHRHIIICGYGTTGRHVIQELRRYHSSFIVIEHDPEVIEQLKAHGILTLAGDALDDEVLLQAGIRRARALITTLRTDSDNVFVVLSARRLAPHLHIVARCADETTEQKLRIAGADSVILPDKIGGTHMALRILKPDITEFIDLITGQGFPDVAFEVINFDALKEEFHGKTLQELDVRRRTGASIVGVKTPEGRYIVNPPSDLQIEPGFKLIVLGSADQIRRVEEIYLDEAHAHVD